MLSRKVIDRLLINAIAKNGTIRRHITNEAVTKKRNEMFTEEAARQRSLIKRIEKIKVQYKGLPEENTLIMNRGLSTPYNCAMHMKEYLMLRSVLALVDGQPWDMHRPLERDCQLEFIHFKDEGATLSNETYWRTCSFVLGYIMERAFKPDYYIQLCSFPKPDVQSGSFVYDMQIGDRPWIPNKIELGCLSRIGGKLHYEDNKFERLEVSVGVAMKMFEDNRFKKEQIPGIASQSKSGSTVTLYRMKDHVDISKGPFIPFSSFIGRFSVVGIHDIESPDYGKLSRVQGISMPHQIPVHFFAYEHLSKRAAILNESAPIPKSPLQPTDNQNLAEATV